MNNIHYVEVGGLSLKEAEAKIQEYRDKFKRPINVMPKGRGIISRLKSNNVVKVGQ